MRKNVCIAGVGIDPCAQDPDRRSKSSSPAAVSAESITASVPSSTALATSNTSARVGNGEVIIDSIIWVAVITRT